MITRTSRKPSRPRTEYLILRVTSEEKENVENLADRLDTTVSDLIRSAIVDYVERVS